MTHSAFIHVFIINRLMNTSPNDIKIDKSAFASHEQFNQAKELVQCLSETGIQHFMQTKYVCNEDDTKKISLLFNQLITKYPKQYNEIISFSKNCIDSSNNKNNKSMYYESQFFNQTDLTSKTFQFLDYSDINQCCLVNSVWLYHGYNINCIYFLDCCVWMNCINDNNDIHSSARKRFLQRLVNIRKFDYASYTHGELSQSLIDEFKKLHNIEEIRIEMEKYGDKEKQLIDIISKQSKQLKDFSCGLKRKSRKTESNCKYNLATFHLENCEIIELRGLVFPILFTNKCTHLYLSFCNNISKQWCENVINNCDLTNIQRIWLDDVSISLENDDDHNRDNDDDSNNINTRTIERKRIINRLASKCISLTRLDISEPNEDILQLWTALMPIIAKNGTFVGLSPLHVESGKNLDESVYKKIIEFTKENKLTINALLLFINKNLFEFYNKLFSMQHIQSTIEHFIALVNNEFPIKLFFQLLTMNININSQFKSLVAYQIVGGRCAIDTEGVIGLLSINDKYKMTKNKCFVGLDWDFVFKMVKQPELGIEFEKSTTNDEHFCVYDDDCELLPQTLNLERLFKVIANMIEEKIPVSVDIRFQIKFENRKHKIKLEKEIVDAFDYVYKKYYLKIFGKYFKSIIDDESKNDANSIFKYTYPECNKYCKYLDIPKFEFIIHDSINLTPSTAEIESYDCIDEDLYYECREFALASLKIVTADLCEMLE